MKQQNKRVLALVESAVMIALATILSILKIMELPYGGSVTLASMLPIAIISYRRGISWGFLSGLVYGVIQQLLGLSNLSYVSTWQSVVAVIMLDYVIAYTLFGIAGIFRKSIKSQPMALSLGCALACLLRYICHVISGATVWAGLSMPTNAALIFSFGYNATYMLPEAIIAVVVATYIGSMIDFRKKELTRLSSKNRTAFTRYAIPVSAMLVVASVIYDVLGIFRNIQTESGFDITGLKNAPITSMAIITSLTILIYIAALVISNISEKRAGEDQ